MLLFELISCSPGVIAVCCGTSLGIMLGDCAAAAGVTVGCGGVSLGDRAVSTSSTAFTASAWIR